MDSRDEVIANLREQQQAISSVLRAVARSEGLQPVLDEIVEAATSLCAGDNGRLWLFKDSLLHAFANFGLAEEYEYDKTHPHPLDRSTMAGRTGLTRAPVHIPDVRADSEYKYEGPAPYRAALGVPILLEDELIGVVGLVRMQPLPFSREYIELVQTFADQAAIAIANARLLDAVRQQLEQQEAVGAVFQAVARSELQVVFDTVIEAANRICHGVSSGLWLSDGEVFRAEALIAKPEQVEYERAHPHVPEAHSLTGRVLLTHKPVHIPDVLADPEYDWAAQSVAGYRAMVGVPILVEDDLIGVLAVTRPVPEPFTDEEIRLVATFADQAAIAIANARLIEAVERQRTELARFVSPQVAELLSSEEGERLLAGHRAHISVLFCDLRGFTAFVETAAPEELFEVLRDYHALIGDLIAAHGATLEHFAGDGVMAFFNDPAPLQDHELHAVRMALALRERFHALAIQWRKRGIELGIGVGIAAGYATLGRIGFDGRYDYGALGPVTNLASRLSTQAAEDQVLIDQRIFAAVEDKVVVEAFGELELKGFARPVAAYEVRENR